MGSTTPTPRLTRTTTGSPFRTARQVAAVECLEERGRQQSRNRRLVTALEDSGPREPYRVEAHAFESDVELARRPPLLPMITPHTLES